MFYVGLDLGQRRDHTAIAVVERREVRRAFLPPAFQKLGVRHIERIPLGTSYPQVVDRVRAIVQREELRGACSLAVDATGVGAPVVDLLRAARLGCEISAVTITGGERAHQMGSVGGVAGWNVPKRDLLAEVEVLLEHGELRIARRLSEAGSLVKELLDIRMTMKSSGRSKLGADGCGEHDDLVIALALACWRAKRPRSGYGQGRLAGI